MKNSIFESYLKKIHKLEQLLEVDSSEKSNLINEIKKISVDKLPYEYDSLEVFIDSETMKTHYNKHYKGYVEKLNKELEKIRGKDLDLEQIISDISSFNTIVRNNGRGAFKHMQFWKMKSPKKHKLDDPIKSKI